jgi:gluconate 5-dehydrogenase
MAKLGKPTDIGWAAVFLTSRAAEFVTGVTLAVDGGVSVGF